MWIYMHAHTHFYVSYSWSYIQTSALLCQPVRFYNWANVCLEQSQKLLLSEYFEMLELTIEATIGRKRVVVATLLAHSVNVATRRHNRKAIAGGGICCRGVSLVPNHEDRPDSCNRGKSAVRIVDWGRNRFVLIPGLLLRVVKSVLLPLAEEMCVWCYQCAILCSGRARLKSEMKNAQEIPGEQRNVTSLPLAKAKPPPSRNTMFHGIFWWTVFQSKRAGGARIFDLLPKIQNYFISHVMFPEKRRTSWWEVSLSEHQETLLPATSSRLWNYLLKQVVGASTGF